MQVEPGAAPSLPAPHRSMLLERRDIAPWGDRDGSTFTCSPGWCVYMAWEPTGARTDISQGAGCCISHGCQLYLYQGCSSPEGQWAGEGALCEGSSYKGPGCSGQPRGVPGAPTADPYEKPSGRHCHAACSGTEQATDRQEDAVVLGVYGTALCVCFPSSVASPSSIMTAQPRVQRQQCLSTSNVSPWVQGKSNAAQTDMSLGAFLGSG